MFQWKPELLCDHCIGQFRVLFVSFCPGVKNSRENELCSHVHFQTGETYLLHLASFSNRGKKQQLNLFNLSIHED